MLTQVLIFAGCALVVFAAGYVVKVVMLLIIRLLYHLESQDSLRKMRTLTRAFREAQREINTLSIEEAKRRALKTLDESNRFVSSQDANLLPEMRHKLPPLARELFDRFSEIACESGDRIGGDYLVDIGVQGLIAIGGSDDNALYLRNCSETVFVGFVQRLVLKTELDVEPLVNSVYHLILLLERECDALDA